MANQEYNKTFLQAESLEEAKEQLEEVYEANPDAVIIVEEEGKERIIEHGKQLNFVPNGGKEGQVLTSDEEGNPKWGESGGGSQVAIESVSGETLDAEANKYYRFDTPVNTLAVTLPNIPEEENPRLKSIVLSFTTGDAPSVEISADADIEYFSGYSIEANTTYELNLMFNGSKWIVAYGVVE